MVTFSKSIAKNFLVWLSAQFAFYVFLHWRRASVKIALPILWLFVRLPIQNLKKSHWHHYVRGLASHFLPKKLRMLGYLLFYLRQYILPLLIYQASHHMI